MVLLANADSTATGMTDGSVALCNAFYYVKKKSGVGKAISFITDVSMKHI